MCTGRRHTSPRAPPSAGSLMARRISRAAGLLLGYRIAALVQFA